MARPKIKRLAKGLVSTKLKPLKLYAAMARDDNGSYHIVGIMHPYLGHMALVNSSRDVVEMGFKLIEPDTRAKTKIV